VVVGAPARAGEGAGDGEWTATREPAWKRRNVFAAGGAPGHVGVGAETHDVPMRDACPVADASAASGRISTPSCDLRVQKIRIVSSIFCVFLVHGLVD
jgi:hypothetical protein